MTTQIRTQDSSPPGRGWLAGLGSAIVDLLFPPYCVACHQFGAWLCGHCQQNVERLSPPLCQQCGLPLVPNPKNPTPVASPAAHEETFSLCSRCQSTPLHLDGLRAYAFHAGPLQEAIHQFKYNDLQSLAMPLGKMMALGWAELVPANLDLDIIIPVPLHPSRQRERGYNQATLLAQVLGHHLGRPVAEGALVRSKATAPQVGLSAQERQQNVSGAFQLASEKLAGKRVLLVDDVCTTGSTLEAASSALHRGGVSFVWAYTLTRAKPGTGSSSI